MSTLRDLRIDAAKGILILLVVFGHLVEPLIQKLPAAGVVYNAVYLFHMPLFVMLAGIFAKQTLDRGYIHSLLARNLLPLVVFQVLYLSLLYLVQGALPSPIWQPYWILWFFLSLAFWRLTLPVVLRLKMPLLLLTLGAILVGYEDAIGYPLSLSRTIYFAPFFLFGFLYGREAIAMAVNHRIVSGVVFFSSMAVAIIGTNAGFSHSLLYGSMGYALTGPHFIEPGAERALVMALSLLSSIAFSGLVVRPWQAAAYIGRRSLTVFVLHGFCVLFIVKLGKVLGVPPLLLMISYAPTALVIGFTLATLDRYLVAFFAGLASRARLFMFEKT